MAVNSSMSKSAKRSKISKEKRSAKRSDPVLSALQRAAREGTAAFETPKFKGVRTLKRASKFIGSGSTRKDESEPLSHMEERGNSRWRAMLSANRPKSVGETPQGKLTYDSTEPDKDDSGINVVAAQAESDETQRASALFDIISRSKKVEQNTEVRSNAVLPMGNEETGKDTSALVERKPECVEGSDNIFRSVKMHTTNSGRSIKVISRTKPWGGDETGSLPLKGWKEQLDDNGNTQFYIRKTKTRSKQKNRRKDNRPEYLKPKSLSFKTQFVAAQVQV